MKLFENTHRGCKAVKMFSYNTCKKVSEWMFYWMKISKDFWCDSFDDEA